MSLPIPSKISRRYKVSKLIFEEDQYCFKIIQINLSNKCLALHTFSVDGKFPTSPLTLMGKALYWVHRGRDLLGAYNMVKKRCYELPLRRDVLGLSHIGLRKCWWIVEDGPIHTSCLCALIGALYHAERTYGQSLPTIWVLDNKDGQLSGIAKDIT